MRKFLQSIFIFSSLLITLPVFAGGTSCGWFGFSDSSCGDPKKIQYCQGSDCTLSGSVEATQNLANNLFTKKSIGQFAQDVVKYFLGFVTLVGVIYVIYAGFQLMTSAGDEEKGKKARKIITYVIVGIIVMWMAYALIRLVIVTLSSAT